MKKPSLIRATLLCSSLLAIACGGKKNNATTGGTTGATGGADTGTTGSLPSDDFDPLDLLPFDPADVNAKFTATVVVSNRAGDHPSATVRYNGTDYTTDANGKIVVPNVQVSGSQSVSVSATGYMPRSLALTYSASGNDLGIRVVLEEAGVSTTVDATAGGVVEHGPMRISLPAGGFKTSGGASYTGTVTVNGLGVDPVDSVIKVTTDGAALREDFDLARIPQGFGVAIDASSQVHFLLPESIFQVTLTDGSGNPLTLDENTPATYRFHLSAITTHHAGDVLPAYTYDDVGQTWVQQGTCTVQAVGTSDDLECVGTTTHFSTWMVASGADTTTGACANIKFHFATTTAYPAEVTLGDGTKKKNPESYEVVSAWGRSNETEAPSPAEGIKPIYSDLTTSCFVQGSPYAQVNVKATFVSVDAAGAAKRDTYLFKFGAPTTGQSAYYAKNIPLLRRNVTAIEISNASATHACQICPPTFLDLDPTGLTPQATAAIDLCAGKDCKNGTCDATSGACKCASGAFTPGTGCNVVLSCSTGFIPDTTLGKCVNENECTSVSPPLMLAGVGRPQGVSRHDRVVHL